MFPNTFAGMSISVNGGSAEENNQMCTVVAAALRAHGFHNVQLQPYKQVPLHTAHDFDTIQAMRRLNPDLFDTPIKVSGDLDDDVPDEVLARELGEQPFMFQPESVTFF